MLPVCTGCDQPNAIYRVVLLADEYRAWTVCQKCFERAIGALFMEPGAHEVIVRRLTENGKTLAKAKMVAQVAN